LNKNLFIIHIIISKHYPAFSIITHSLVSLFFFFFFFLEDSSPFSLITAANIIFIQQFSRNKVKSLPDSSKVELADSDPNDFFFFFGTSSPTP